MRRNIHGGAYEDTSIKHLSSIQKPFPKALYISGLWCSVVSLYLLPHLPPSSLCAVLVLFLRCFSFSLFFALAHSDAFNASRVMQVQAQTALCGQSTHGKMEMSL